MAKRIVQSFEENDTFTGWRRVSPWKSGRLRRAKRRYHKKERRWGRREIREQQDQGD
jgi:hypothetical protein